MRQFKTQFHGGTEKDIIVLNCYVPSDKRKKAMTPEMKKEAKKWATRSLQSIKAMLDDIVK